MAQFLKRREMGSGKAKEVESRALESVDPAFFKKYPALSEFLWLDQWDAETPRTRGTFTVFFEEGSFKAALNDRDGGSVAFVSKGSFTALLDALEKGLVGHSLDWRESSKKGGAKGKKG